MRGQLRRWAPAAALGAGLVVLLAYVMPLSARNPLGETFAWAIVVMAAFAGFGSLLRFLVARDEPVDLGLRMIWGAGTMAFIGGLLTVPSAMNRSAALALVDVGVVLALAAIVWEREGIRRTLRYAARVARREPRLMVVVAVVSGLALLQFLAGISEWHTNPYDDDIAYLAFLRKLVDTGSFPEPFSFRRLSAYGGQTFFLELLLPRADWSQSHTFDRSVCVALVLALLVGHRSGRKRPTVLFVIAGAMLLLTLQSVAINTGSYFSGVAFFLGIFRTLVWLGDRDRTAWKAALPVALVSAAACTLRQNYMPIPAVMLATSYIFRFRTRTDLSIKERVAEPLFAAGFSVIALVPWMIGAWQSNHTFLYPVMLGTFNKALSLNASGMTFVREVYMQVWIALEGGPLRAIGFFVLAAVFVREPGSRKPMWSLAIGAAAGFVMLVHGLTQSDPGSIGRYAFGFLGAFALAVTLTTGTTRISGKVARPHVAAAIAIFALLVQLFQSREQLIPAYTREFHNIDELRSQAPRSNITVPPERVLYKVLQEKVPQGARIAVLVDEPYLLDFARNPIWNLDMPGYASLPPGMPYFKGSQAVEDYLRGIGVRYLVFVRPEYSRYHYRRDYWVEMMVNEWEIWRTFAPYCVDFIDNLVDLARRHHKLAEERGIVVLDLEQAP